MLAVGQKYIKNGKIFTVKSFSTERCINGKTTVQLEDSCGHITPVDSMELVTNYTGWIEGTQVIKG